MTDKCETCRDCRATILLPPSKVSNLYAILCGCYGSPNVKNRMCKLCTFSQIRSQLCDFKHASVKSYDYLPNNLSNYACMQL